MQETHIHTVSIFGPELSERASQPEAEKSDRMLVLLLLFLGLVVSGHAYRLPEVDKVDELARASSRVHRFMRKASAR